MSENFSKLHTWLRHASDQWLPMIFRIRVKVCGCPARQALCDLSSDRIGIYLALLAFLLQERLNCVPHPHSHV